MGSPNGDVGVHPAHSRELKVPNEARVGCVRVPHGFTDQA